jgi:hypothetical protein
MGLNERTLWMHQLSQHAQGEDALFETAGQVSPQIAEGAEVDRSRRRSLGRRRRTWLPVSEPFGPAGYLNNQLIVLGPTRDFYGQLVLEEAQMTALRELVQRAVRAAAGVAEAATDRIVNWVDESWDIETLTDEGTVSPMNEGSVVLELRHEGARVLLTAHAGQRAMTAVADVVDGYGFAAAGGYDLIQIPHHGRRSVGPTVLNPLAGDIGVRPRASWMAFACVSANADAKHPAKKVLNAFTRRAAASASTKAGSIRWWRNAPPSPGLERADPVGAVARPCGGRLMFDLDVYTRGARLAPAYLVFSPVVVFVVALWLGTSDWWSKLGGALAGCGAPIIAAEWARSGGRGKQEALWAKWGGPPTTKLLRFAEGGSAAAVNQRHQDVERVTGSKLPTAAEESADPKTADEKYATAVTSLRAKTEKEELVLRENTLYGFRRNLWERKPFGIAVAAVILLASVGLLIAAAVGHAWGSWPAAAVVAGFAALALLVWLTMVDEDWVHEAADAYPERLMQTATRLPAHE